MKRLLVMTVGKTHSGKSTFAQNLAKVLPNAAVIDQDNQAEFLHAHYHVLLPKDGPNRIKTALSRTIIEYAADETDCHLILCNANREEKSRRELLSFFRRKGFTCLLVSFDMPESLLQERVSSTTRSISVLRSAASFSEVLVRQGMEDVQKPDASEADHLFVIRSEADVEPAIREILRAASC